MLGDYYVDNYQRKDKLTGELIPFKNYKQYFSTEFINKRNMNKWCAEAPTEEVKDFIVSAFDKKLKAKGVSAGPPSSYLESTNLPDIE